MKFEKKAKAEAERANANKTEFLALASHDILQPLNAARLYLGALQDSPLDGHSQEILQKLSDSVNSTETLISTLLEIARFDQGAIKPVLSDCSINEILAPVIAEFTVIAAAKGLQIRTRMQDCYVHTDAVYLRRIVQNFVSNAVKYTSHGKVLLACRKRKDHISIQVWDTGVGIPPREQDKIFDDFYRWHNTKETGLGLGLGLVKRMQTALSLTSKVQSSPSKGSCFSITVPLAKSTCTNKAPRATAAMFEASDKTLDVWCIDDDSNNLDAMRTLLEKWQCRVSCFNHTQDCLAALGQADLLLVDYQLANNDNGLELIQTLREKAQYTIPAALITAVRDAQLTDRCKSLKVHYMPKPAKPAKLRALIQSIEKNT